MNIILFFFVNLVAAAASEKYVVIRLTFFFNLPDITRVFINQSHLPLNSFASLCFIG